MMVKHTGVLNDLDTTSNISSHEACEVRVEVHWQINPSCYCISFDDIDIWQHLETLILRGRSVPALSPESLLDGRMVTADRRFYDGLHEGPARKHLLWVGDLE